MRVGRRGLVLLLGSSLLAALVLIVAALVHEPAQALAPSGMGRVGGGADPAIERLEQLRSHEALEVILWAAAVVVVGSFGVGVALLRREVRIEKHRMHRRAERRALVRQVLDYELARRGPRMNN